MHKMKVVLAVALPLLLCLLSLLILLVFSFLRFRRRNSILLGDLRWVNAECAELKSKLAAPRPWGTENLDTNFPMDFEVKLSAMDFDGKLGNYIQKWIDCDKASMNESPARIEARLFPEILQPYPDPLDEHQLSEIPPESFISVGKDLRLFPNPHQYSPSDICTLLEQKHTRDSISEHIIASTILKAVSIDENPMDTLLPMRPSDVYALSKVLSLIQGLYLYTAVPVYIRRFGFPHQSSSKKRIPGFHTKEDDYIDFFESLLEPYFTSNSEESTAQRKLEFEEVLEAAVVHGMKVLGFPGGKIEYRWGTRNAQSIVVSPAIYNLVYEHQKLKYATEVSKIGCCWSGGI